MKHCNLCGCIMDERHESDICECCYDDIYESDPGEEVSEY